MSDETEEISLENEIRCYGPPGCGKTTWITSRVKDTVRHRGSDAVIACSFTKTAAAELAGRDMPLPAGQIGTLHALAYRSIDRPAIAQERIADWNQENEYLALSGAKAAPEDLEAVEGFGGPAPGDKLMQLVDRYRALRVPEELWTHDAIHFSHKWTEWKTEEDVIDFTDMIEIAINETETAPGNPTVGFFDEVQDFTPLELRLIRHWGSKMERVILCGDDDQAQAPWTKVRTADHGWVSMDQLDPEVHRLVSYDIPHSVINGLRNGHAFKIASHEENGPSVRVQVGDKTTDCTPEHRWWVKTDKARDKWVVYLMRKGDWWRVGWCQVAKADGVFHLGARANLEGADAAWVLSVCESKADASMWESVVAAEYGIPTAMFKPIHDQEDGLYSAEVIKGIFSRLSGDAVNRAQRCLSDHGRMIEHPLWEPGTRSIRGTQVTQIRACNLLEGVHYVPLWGGSGSKVEWSPVQVEDGPFIERAYSIEVKPHHTYVVDGGIVTSNCIYSFKGATPDAFLYPTLPEDQKRVLSQSYRVPVAVHAVAQRWVERLSVREPKDYLPREEQGTIRRGNFNWQTPEPLVNDICEQIANDRTVMVLAATSYMLDKVKHRLRAEGVPFWNQYRRNRGDWNPLGRVGGRTTTASDRVIAYLRADPDQVPEELARPWHGKDLKAWIGAINSKGILARGAKSVVSQMPDNRLIPYEEIVSLFGSEEHLNRALQVDVDWLSSNLLSDKQRSMAYPLKVAETYGVEGLISTPRVMLGTVHSVKGGQSDVVYLLPDLSSAGYRQWMDPTPAGKDATIRQFYVGMTRAREELVICEPVSHLCVDPALMLTGAIEGGFL